MKCVHCQLPILEGEKSFRLHDTVPQEFRHYDDEKCIVRLRDTLQSEREAREEADETCTHWMVEANKARQRVAELERERQRDALDGQAALDEANNAVAAARTAALEEAAQTCIDLWKNATNVRHKVMRLDHVQNAISHGCIASAAAIRAMKGGEG